MREKSNRNGKIIEMQLAGYRLSTAEILYWMPDYPNVLQSFVWQQYDMPPEFPELHRFLSFWKNNIEATLHTVQVACSESMASREVQSADAVYRIH